MKYLTGKSNYINFRGLNFHYLTWGDETKPTIVLLHGYLDHSHTFDFLNYYLADHFNLIAWDARGHGKSDWMSEDGYYHFAEYIYDLYSFLKSLNLDKVHLVGHSMGGMIASLFSGVYPEKVNKLVSMEGWLVTESHFSEAPKRLRKWIESTEGYKPFKEMSNLSEAVKRLKISDALMSDEIAYYLAEKACKNKGNGLVWRHDPLHRTRSPYPFYLGQGVAFWENIISPTLLIEGDKSNMANENLRDRFKHFRNSDFVCIENAAHNLHLHQPEIISNKIIEFILD